MIYTSEHSNAEESICRYIQYYYCYWVLLLVLLMSYYFSTYCHKDVLNCW